MGSPLHGKVEMHNAKDESTDALDNCYFAYPADQVVPQTTVNSEKKAVLTSLERLEGHLKCLQHRSGCLCSSANRTASVEEHLPVLLQSQELDARLKLASTRCKTLEERLKYAEVVVQSTSTLECEDLTPKQEFRLSAVKSLALTSVTENYSKPPPYTNFFPMNLNKEDCAVHSTKSCFEISSLSVLTEGKSSKSIAKLMGMPPFDGAGDRKFHMPAMTPATNTSEVCDAISIALPLKSPQQLDEYPVRLVDPWEHFLTHQLQRKSRKKTDSETKQLFREEAVFSFACEPGIQVTKELEYLSDHQRGLEKIKRNDSNRQQKPSCPKITNLTHTTDTISKDKDLQVVTRATARQHHRALPVKVSTVNLKHRNNASSDPVPQSFDSSDEAITILIPWKCLKDSVYWK